MTGDAPEVMRDGMHLAVLSGMHLEELCMLGVRDCGNGVFVITQSKTDSGLRSVPIHPANAA
jgi:integrase